MFRTCVNAHDKHLINIALDNYLLLTMDGRADERTLGRTDAWTADDRADGLTN